MSWGWGYLLGYRESLRSLGTESYRWKARGKAGRRLEPTEASPCLGQQRKALAVLVGSISETVFIDSKYIFYMQSTAVCTAEDIWGRVTGILMTTGVGGENPKAASSYDPQQELVSPFHTEEGPVTSTSLSDRGLGLRTGW